MNKLSKESKVLIFNGMIGSMLYSLWCPVITKALYENLAQWYFYIESGAYCIGGALITWLWTRKATAEFVKKHFVGIYILLITANIICGFGGYVIGGTRGFYFYAMLSIITNCILQTNINNLFIDIKAKAFQEFRAEYDRTNMLMSYVSVILGSGLGLISILRFDNPFYCMIALTIVDVQILSLELIVAKKLIKSIVKQNNE